MTSRMKKQSATIKRGTSSRDSTGLVTTTYADAATGVMGSAQSLGDKLSQTIFGRVGVGEYVFFCEYTVDLRAADLLVIDGDTYEVTAVIDEAGRHDHWAAAMVPWKPGAA